MKVNITVDILETDTIRGYHDRNGTITFGYIGQGKPSVEWEKGVVDSLIGQGWNMWESAVRTTDLPTDSQWTVKYGYDSGD